MILRYQIWSLLRLNFLLALDQFLCAPCRIVEWLLFKFKKMEKQIVVMFILI